MTVTLDLPPRLAGRVEADARTQNRAVADLVLDAVADRWDGEDEGESDNGAAPFKIPAADIEALRESLAEADRGERLNGPDVMREAFARAESMAAAA